MAQVLVLAVLLSLVAMAARGVAALDALSRRLPGDPRTLVPLAAGGALGALVLVAGLMRLAA